MDITSFVENNYNLFDSFDKPDLATDIHHCEECRDHNDEVDGAVRRELSSEQIGTASWGISSFLTPQSNGILYSSLYRVSRLQDRVIRTVLPICAYTSTKLACILIPSSFHYLAMSNV